MLAIRTSGLTKHYGGRTAVDDLSLEVPAGCVYGFLGPNGAGKTTTMRMLTGLVTPDAGTVEIGGMDLRRQRLRALTGVAALIEGPAAYAHLSGTANLDVTRRLLGLPKSETERVLEVVGLGAASGRRVRGYSLGMRQRLGIARALLGRPTLLILDEPTNGLDPEGIADMRTLIRSLPGRTGGTVLVASHLLSEIEQVADRVGLMREGRLVLDGPVKDLIARGSVVRFVLDDGARGAALIRDVTGAFVETDGAAVRVEIAAADASQGVRTSQLVAALVAAGIGVQEVAPATRTLEDVYRKAS